MKGRMPALQDYQPLAVSGEVIAEVETLTRQS